MKNNAVEILFVAVLVLFLPLVSAQEPEIKIYPRYLLPEKDMAIKVTPNVVGKPVRVVGCISDGFGGLEYCFSFPIDKDGNGLCYFSNEDGNATCGPVPLPNVEGFPQITVFATTPQETTNTTEGLTTANKNTSISIDTEEVRVINSNTVAMIFHHTGADEMKYNVYDERLESVISNRPLKKDFSASSGYYFHGNLTLNPGVYFFEFLAHKESGDEWVGVLKRVEIAQGNWVEARLDKESYYSGDRLVISGNASDRILGQVNFPNGSKAIDLVINIEADGSFSKQIEIPISWGSGDYKVKINEPAEKEIPFHVSKLLEITPERISGEASDGEFNSLVMIKNYANTQVNITSYEVSGNVNWNDVKIDKTSLNPGEEATMSINISGMQASVSGNIILHVKAGERTVDLTIPVSVGMQTSCPPREESVEVRYVSAGISVEPPAIFKECVEGEEIEETLTIKNNADETISLSYDVVDSYNTENSLEELYDYGKIEVTFGEGSLAPEEETDAKVSITPGMSGVFSGYLRIESEEGNIFTSVPVYLTCIRNVESDVDDLSSELSSKIDVLPGDVYSEINSMIEEAQSALSNGNYRDAMESYQKAKAMMKLADTYSLYGGEREAPKEEGGGINPLLVLIPLIIIIIAVILLFLFKLRGGKAEGEEEEFFEEEEGF